MLQPRYALCSWRFCSIIILVSIIYLLRTIMIHIYFNLKKPLAKFLFQIFYLYFYNTPILVSYLKQNTMLKLIALITIGTLLLFGILNLIIGMNVDLDEEEKKWKEPKNH